MTRKSQISIPEISRSIFLFLLFRLINGSFVTACVYTNYRKVNVKCHKMSDRYNLNI